MAENEQDIQQQTTTENTEPKAEEQAFRTFKTQKEFDDFSAYLIKKGEEKVTKTAKVVDGEATFDAKEYERKYRKDLEAQIRADIEKQAKMTEAEKLADEKAKLLEDIKNDRISINQDLARIELKNAGFDDEEMEVYLDFVTDDREVSLGKIKRVCDSRKATVERQRKSILDELQAKMPNTQFAEGSTGNALQNAFNAAKQNGNMLEMSRIIREAQEKGIRLNESINKSYEENLLNKGRN